ncbi:MAG TPA: SCO family protein [Solirubrobacteraceae bacterium]|nr:SCO family protein [Solirubrobacteraceae bacterium]
MTDEQMRGSDSLEASGAPAPVPTGSPRGGSRLGLVSAAVLLVAIVAGAGLALLGGSTRARLPNGARQLAPGQGFFGTLAVPAKPAPPISLRNYLGQRVTLRSYRGRPVLVTFLYTHCPDVCPLIASNLGVALRSLGARSSRTQVIAVSVDPHGDTPASVAAFLRSHGLSARMQYLIGSAAELGRTWSAWSVGSQREAGNPSLVAHSALVYGISASGRITTIYAASFAPAQIAHDLPKLAAL